MIPVRRSLLKGGAALGALALAPALVRAQSTPERRFAPMPGDWRTFEITTRVELADPVGATRIWLPVPSIDSHWQRSLDSSYTSNGSARMAADGVEGARMVYAEFAAGVKPVLEVTSRVQTRNRADLNAQRSFEKEDAATLRHYTRATALLPTDGIVRQTALKAIQSAKTDEAKARAIYNWVVANAWREPKVRGCGEGDIKTMLETGNMGGKCADINALFVGLCRSVGLPARDVYGIRLVPSAFGYKELSGNPTSLKGAQHCRAEVYLQAHGWVDGPGRRGQGHAPGNARVDQDHEPQRGGPGLQAPVWRLGRQLDGLEHGPRPEAARCERRRAELPDVPGGRDRRRPRGLLLA